MPAAGGFSYSFNPCIPFDEGKACKNVAGCQIDAVGRVDYDIGAADKVTFSFDNKNNYLIGTYESADRVRHSIVNYICDPTVDPPKTSVAGEVQSATYSFSIVSKYACPTYVPPKVNCTQLDQCSCRFDDGRGTVDLSGIAMHGTPLISDVKAGLYYYSFNPCFPFTEGTCQGVAGCQLENSSKSDIYTDIAAVSSVDLSFDGSNIVGNYTSADGSRNTIVTYVCDATVEKPIAIVNGEPCERTYAFTIVSKDICPKEPTVTTEASADETLYFWHNRIAHGNK